MTPPHQRYISALKIRPKNKNGPLKNFNICNKDRTFQKIDHTKGCRVGQQNMFLHINQRHIIFITKIIFLKKKQKKTIIALLNSNTTI